MSVLIIRSMGTMIVAGAGPAGSACAWRLASAGLECVLVDRASFPRSKVCGGVLSGRASNLLLRSGMLSEAELDDITVQTHSRMTAMSDFKFLRTYTGGHPLVRLVDRTGFDAFLRRRALEEGAVPLQDSFIGMEGCTAAFKSGRRIAFDRMVGADGACSRVRRSMNGGRFARPSPALSAFVTLSESAMEQFREPGLQIFFFTGLYGYGWLFPRREDLIVGIGSFGSDTSNLRKLMSRLLMHTGLGTSRQVRGASLPAGRQPVNPGGGNCLLAGDAAGLCDRVSGEGIFHALESGMAAAEAIIEGRDTWDKNSLCIRLVRQSAFYRHLLYGRPFHRLAMRSLAGRERWFTRYWGVICGSGGYSELLRV